MFHIESDVIALQTFQCPSRVWKVRTDPHSSSLALELRDEASKSVSFAWVNDAGDFEMVKGQERVDWWIGLEDFREGVLLIHGYQEQGLPLHQGLAAVEASSGKVLWEMPEAGYFGMVAEGILLREPGKHGLELRGLRSGKLVGGFEEEGHPGLLTSMDAYHLKQIEQLQFPIVVQPGNEYHAFWARKIGSSPFGPVWAAVARGFSIAAWHEGTPGTGFALAMAIFRDDELLMDGWLEEGMTGMAPDPYFLHRGRVVAIKDKTKLVTVGLSQR